MIRRLTLPTLALALLAVAAAPAAAQPRVSVSVDYGMVRALSGTYHTDATGIVLGMPASVQAREYDEILDNETHFSVSVGYLFNQDSELRFGIFRTTGESNNVQVGSVGGQPLFAQFDDYEVTGFDIGYRQFFGTVVQPYLGTSGGWARVSAINGNFTVPSAGISLPNTAMFNESTVLQFGFSGGVHVPVGPNFGIYGGVDFRYLGELDDEDGLAGTGLEGLNDDTVRWVMPVSVGVRIKF